MSHEIDRFYSGNNTNKSIIENIPGSYRLIDENITMKEYKGGNNMEDSIETINTLVSENKYMSNKIFDKVSIIRGKLIVGGATGGTELTKGEGITPSIKTLLKDTNIVLNDMDGVLDKILEELE